jgi:hypothetical protein
MRQGGPEGRQTCPSNKMTLKEENTSAAERMEKSGKGSILEARGKFMGSTDLHQQAKSDLRGKMVPLASQPMFVSPS